MRFDIREIVQLSELTSPMDGNSGGPSTFDDAKAYRTVSVELSLEEFAAVEAWRTENNLSSISVAIREMVRFGLLSEISKIHSVVSAVRKAVDRDANVESL